MAFNPDLLSRISPAAGQNNMPAVWAYRDEATDTKSTIVSSGYFNATVVTTPPTPNPAPIGLYQFQQYDVILVTGTDGVPAWYYVTSANGATPVTLAPVATS